MISVISAVSSPTLPVAQPQPPMPSTLHEIAYRSGLTLPSVGSSQSRKNPVSISVTVRFSGAPIDWGTVVVVVGGSVVVLVVLVVLLVVVVSSTVVVVSGGALVGIALNSIVYPLFSSQYDQAFGSPQQTPARRRYDPVPTSISIHESKPNQSSF